MTQQQQQQQDISFFHLGPSASPWKCTVVREMEVENPIENVFRGAPMDMVLEELSKQQANVVEKNGGKMLMVPYTIFHLKTSQNSVLIDTGFGILGSGRTDLFTKLNSAGIERTEIDTVIITHPHVDHIGNLIDEEGKDAFPKAKIVLGKADYTNLTGTHPNLGHFLEDSPDLAKKIAERIRDQLRKIDTDKLVLVQDSKFEVAPGINVRPFQGHTDSSLIVEVMPQEGRELLHIGDAIFHPLHASHLDWTPAYDHKPQEAKTVRQWIVEEGLKTNAIIVGSHFPFPCVGHWHRADKTVTWVRYR